MYLKVFRSSPFPFGNTDRVSGRHTIVVPIGTSQDACVEKQKCASLAQLRIYRSGTRKRAEVLPCGLPDRGLIRSLRCEAARRFAEV